ncbi:hypothetical protein F0358_14355 [Empedobacter brevis]|uniref:Uncharacterized protein n=1 Tax=Empedobacter brevis NBRC 14943 = ATCC 43319 TaxID=1218108 RepID=A0A511NIY5_9FLAO|nr:hypothetical protein [Empedobacter brevis]QES93820.1 hypothetical protein F0358_14355 [Empedobacter brevis]QHC85677.1 hypothetical protein AS589_13225 [Empedobacter brevis]GEM52647.1 hypothetical protein EB1_24370 [Empedobacter brevis NBRC 14943 = ATCC 43319]
MNDLNYDSIKNKIESEVCPIHQKNAVFVKTTESFNIAACCEDFKTEMIEKSNYIVAEETKKNIDNILKKAFEK